jgi:hypothetical protein
MSWHELSYDELAAIVVSHNPDMYQFLPIATRKVPEIAAVAVAKIPAMAQFTSDQAGSVEGYGSSYSNLAMVAVKYSPWSRSSTRPVRSGACPLQSATILRSCAGLWTWGIPP